MPSSPKNSEDVTEPSVVPHKEISISTSVLHVSHGVQANFGMSHQEALASVTAQAKLKLQSEFQSVPSSNSVSSMTSILPMHQRPFAPACNSSKALEIIDCQNNCTNTETTGASLNTPHNDGFNWRKYGQRPVKGSDCCRSYYRCINSECHVKKRIERYPGGKIKDIGYKGQHNHDPPPRVRNSREGLQASRSSIESDIVIISDRKSSVSYPFSTSKDQIHGHNDDQKQHDSSDGGAIPGTSEMNDDEPDPKRRMAETNTVHHITQLKSDPEPRIILQRETDLGAFNDGYRWRKYGQKIVKGNSNPRSYYKCTVMECPVRKHVERASDNTNTFIITYEGKHNHGPPPGPRNDNDLTSMDGQDSPDTIIPPSEYCADLPITNLSKPKDRHDIESSYLSPSKVDNTVSCKLLAPQSESVKSDSFDEKPMEIGEKRALESTENSSSIDSSSGSLDVSDGKKFDVIDQQILNEKHAAVSV